MSRVFAALLGCAWLLGISGPAAAISFTINYDATVSTAERAVVDQAAAYWVSFVTSAQSFAVNVTKAPLTGGLLGLADAYSQDLGGAPTGGNITIDSGTSFFVDPSPADNSEYVQNTSPPTRFHSGPPQFDLLTVALHEFGHILGFTSFFPGFAGNVQSSPDTTQQVYVFQSAATLESGFYQEGVFFTHGAVYLPASVESPNDAGVGSGISHFDPQFLGGTAARVAFDDLMNPTLQLGERFLIGAPELDVLADAYGYTVVPEPGTLVLLGGGLLTLTRLRRRSSRR